MAPTWAVPGLFQFGTKKTQWSKTTRFNLWVLKNPNLSFGWKMCQNNSINTMKSFETISCNYAQMHITFFTHGDRFCVTVRIFATGTFRCGNLPVSNVIKSDLLRRNDCFAPSTSTLDQIGVINSTSFTDMARSCSNFQ